MKILALSDVAEIIAGQSPDSSTYNTDGEGLPFFQGKADFKEKFPKVRIWCNSEKRKEAKPGDILMSVRAPVGSVNICDQQSIIGRGLSAIRPMQGVNAEYLYFFFKVNEEKIASLGTGSTFKAITQEVLKKVKIPLPPLEDQIRIAHLLGKVESLIAQRKKDIEQLDQLLKSVFLEMFGDPVRNEKGWEKRALGTLSDIQGGLQVSAKRSGNPLEVPYLRVANVYRDRLDLSVIKAMQVTESELKRIRLKKDDVLVVEGHGNPTEIGRSAVWDGTIEDCIHQNHLIRVRVNRDVISPLFTSFYINSPGGRSQMLKAGKTTSGLNTISTKNVKETQIPIPPLPIQNQFATILEKAKVVKAKYSSSLTDLEILYNILSQQAFKGDLNLSRVSIDAIVQIDSPFEMHSDIPNPSVRTTDAEPVAVRAFTRKDIEAALTNLLGPQPFSSLLNKLEEKSTIDQQAYHDIRAILYQMAAEKKLDQIFDETKMETVQLADGNSESFVPMRLALR